MSYYEAMLLFDTATATKDWDACIDAAHQPIVKHGGKVVRSGKWDERKLAYEIKDSRRGTYFLMYFEAPPAGLEKIRREYNISDKVLRHLIFVLDDEDVRRVEKAAVEGEKKKVLVDDDDDNYRDDDDGDGRRRRRRRDYDD